jgi:hypothetical protein
MASSWWYSETFDASERLEMLARRRANLGTARSRNPAGLRLSRHPHRRGRENKAVAFGFHGTLPGDLFLSARSGALPGVVT